MGFKRRAADRRKAAAAKEPKPEPKTYTEEEAIQIVMGELKDYNETVRGFTEAGSCITDSMLFCNAMAATFKIPAVPVCSDLAAFGRSRHGEYQLQLWHKGHDGNDPRYPDDYRSNPKHYGPSGTGYDGHIVVRTPNFIIDPTFGQLNREGKIKVPLMALLSLEDFGPIDPNNDLHAHFLKSHTITMFKRPQRVIGEKQNSDATHSWDVELPLLLPASIEPEMVHISNHKEDGIITFFAHALRTDIDFETELQKHIDTGTLKINEDSWRQEREVHSRKLIGRMRERGWLGAV